MNSGRVAFGRMEAVSFGVPLEEAVAEEAERLGASRIFLMVSGTLNRETGEIEKLRRALGNKVAGQFEPHGAAHAAPGCNRGDGGRTRRGRRSHRHFRRRFADRRRQGGADVPRERHPHSRGDGRAARPGGGTRNSADQHPDHAFGRRVQRHRGRHGRAGQAEGAVPPSGRDSERGHPRPGADGAYAGMAVPLDRRARGGPLR